LQFIETTLTIVQGGQPDQPDQLFLNHPDRT